MRHSASPLFGRAGLKPIVRAFRCRGTLGADINQDAGVAFPFDACLHPPVIANQPEMAIDPIPDLEWELVSHRAGASIWMRRGMFGSY